MLSFLNREQASIDDPAWQRFVAALPADARAAVSQAVPGNPATLFAVRSPEGALQWGLVEALSTARGQSQEPKWRLVPREVDAVGTLRVDGHLQPISAHFEQKLVRFEVGRRYRGMMLNPEPFAFGRKLIRSIDQEAVHLEKPTGVSWGESPALLQKTMQRFKGLTDPWTWPGRVELAVSASSTGETLFPFLMYYLPTVGQKNVANDVESFVRDLLAQASPQTMNVTLPDDSVMLEFRHDPESIQKEALRNPYGQLFRFSTPGKSQKILVFHADIGETWISNDVQLIQAGLLANLNALTPNTSCDKDGAGGFATFSGTSVAAYGAFTKVNVTVKNLETGLFTVCGYY
ncbi:MAG: hypothetical protein QY323_04365 [Patescibacteria group bacterium]|nr:MAG: hypothetical protein QY323_04365 [Patescibacteria group bacterium]